MPALNENAETHWLVYDGECYFCRNYADYIRVRAALPGLMLLNAREKTPEAWSQLPPGIEAFDLNEGMLFYHQGRWHHGADALHALAGLTPAPQAVSWLHRHLFGTRGRAELLYPWLRQGRNLYLRLKGQPPIGP